MTVTNDKWRERKKVEQENETKSRGIYFTLLFVCRSPFVSMEQRPKLNWNITLIVALGWCLSFAFVFIFFIFWVSWAVGWQDLSFSLLFYGILNTTECIQWPRQPTQWFKSPKFFTFFLFFISFKQSSFRLITLHFSWLKPFRLCIFLASLLSRALTQNYHPRPALQTTRSDTKRELRLVVNLERATDDKWDAVAAAAIGVTHTCAAHIQNKQLSFCIQRRLMVELFTGNKREE